MIDDAKKTMSKARSALLLDDPFWGSLAMRLRFVEDLTCKTAWVDGKSLGYNPAFIESLTSAEVKALVAHEVGHCVLGHPWRRTGREFDRWNEACDRALNPELRDAGFLLPECALLELEPEHRGKSAEWIFARLPTPASGDDGQGNQGGQGGQQDGQQGGQGQEGQDGEGDGGQGEQDGQGDQQGGQGSHPQGEVRDAPKGAGEGEGETPTEEDWKQATVQAAMAASARGKLPLGAERLLKQANKSAVDWRSALRRFAQERARADYSWRRPNQRYMPSGVYLPSLCNEEVGMLAIGVDTSGSVDAVLLSQFEAEIQAIADEVRPSTIRVLYCDAKVHRQEEFERGEPVKLNPAGGGGTSFVPVFDAIEEWEDEPVCVLYLTDLYGRFPAQEPAYPVMWVTGQDSRVEVPFGEVLVAM